MTLSLGKKLVLYSKVKLSGDYNYITVTVSKVANSRDTQTTAVGEDGVTYTLFTLDNRPIWVQTPSDYLDWFPVHAISLSAAVLWKDIAGIHTHTLLEYCKGLDFVSYCDVHQLHYYTECDQCEADIPAAPERISPESN